MITPGAPAADFAHLCTARPVIGPLGSLRGCPHWPSCLPRTPAAARPAHYRGRHRRSVRRG